MRERHPELSAQHLEGQLRNYSVVNISFIVIQAQWSRLKSSGMLCHVIGQMIFNISKDFSAFIFTVK
jgi:hypothetical protein